MERLNNKETEGPYGYGGHRCVLYATSRGDVIPDDLIWYHTDPDDWTINGYDYKDARPVAVVISHSSDKYYYDNLQQALLIPSSWSYELVWRDEEWFEANKGLLVRYLGMQDGMRGNATTRSEFTEIDMEAYNEGYWEGEKVKARRDAEKQGNGVQ